MTASAIGTLIKKTHRHDACCTSQPPRTGPIAVVMDVKPDQVPMARPRSPLGNDTLIRARLPGTRSAPPTPCRQRAAMSCPMLGAKPHHTDAAANRMTPPAKTLRRLKRSPRDPPVSSKAARKSVYASTTHCTSPMVACKPDCNAGSATFTAVPSMKAMLEPRMATVNTHEPPAARSPGVPARIAPSSQGGLAMFGMNHCEPKIGRGFLNPPQRTGKQVRDCRKLGAPALGTPFQKFANTLR